MLLESHIVDAGSSEQHGTSSGTGDHQEGSLVAREVVVVILRKAGVQVPVWQVHCAEAGRIDVLEEEVVDERIVVALVVHVVGVGHFVTSPAKCSLLWWKYFAPSRMLGNVKL